MGSDNRVKGCRDVLDTFTRSAERTNHTIKKRLAWRGADSVGVKCATIYGGCSPRSGRPRFESWTWQHLPNVSPSLYPSFLSAYCQKIKATSAGKKKTIG
ncbi:hypothetical protein AMECASPLE_038647 [Ameca splendens]|uniref:Uncharacterized protein n=1 Tax=Ameca splendens TaxID=208324 RepID=A0ABV0XXH6_9TELE